MRQVQKFRKLTLSWKKELYSFFKGNKVLESWVKSQLECAINILLICQFLVQ